MSDNENEVEFLKFLVKNLVRYKEDVVIDRKEDELGILLILRVNNNDMGIIIWKSWNTVDSLRTLLKVLGSRKEKRINLKILN